MVYNNYTGNQRTPLKSGCELGEQFMHLYWQSLCFTCYKPGEWGKDQIVTQRFHNG